MAIPAQMMKDVPYLSEFIMLEAVGSKIGTAVPGIVRHSYREYFYMRLMNIPLFFMRVAVFLTNMVSNIVKFPVSFLPGYTTYSVQPRSLTPPILAWRH